jgi:hypothetical protein
MGTSKQRAAGLTNPRVYRSVEDQNEIVVVLDSSDMKEVKDFAASAETTMRAGVIDVPSIHFLETA